MKVVYEQNSMLDYVLDYNGPGRFLFRSIRMVRILGILSLLILLQSCQGTPFASLIGAETVVAGTSSYSTYKTITITKAGIDTGLAISGKKTTTDMFISSITGKDCDVIRLIKYNEMRFVCLDIVPEYEAIGEK
jgi:hypothetical protein